ncbi:glycosyltransferase [Rhodohalobacter barkolensis]|uniref:Glycosyl transferase n=1 Tax=Rhodohalobacter barkolensis TaxID=2053187 RepID=A0A2N0VKE0_9BACT|nr:glycosyltransferase [Rhodohalobacter barkolensis]PKD44652.1 glycosyl transferase [Rhodohalobacter barkolensis]
METDKVLKCYKDPVLITEHTWDEEIKPIVSICTITFNHKKYIRDAIEGILIQKTTFPVEIIIHDDASTDSTATIIREYKKEYPDLFRIILQDENQWSKGGGSIYARFVFPEAKGKYIALCEGDDYWTDPLKLQKQVEFMEENPDYGAVFTDYNRLHQDTGNIIYSFYSNSGKSIPQGKVFQNLIYENPFVTCTSLFLKEFVDLDRFKKVGIELNKIYDKALWLEIAAHKKIGYLSESTATYRVLNNSASNHTNIENLKKFKQKGLKVVKKFAEHYNVEIDEDKIIRSYNRRMLINLLKMKSFKEYFKFESGITDKIYVASIALRRYLKVN